MNELLDKGGVPTSSIDPTRRALAQMLVEDTGTHFLDSGGVGGRHFQLNRAIVDFERTTPHPLRFRTVGEGLGGDFAAGDWWVDTHHHVYHWLAERLTLDTALDALFESLVAWSDDNGLGGGWLSYPNRWADPAVVRECLDDATFTDDELREAAEAYLVALDRGAVTGLYGDGAPFVVNTYNGPDMLSQTLQYLYLEVDGRALVLLSIHGGCDVRGGYGRPRFFELDDEVAIFDNARGYLVPSFEPSEPDPPTWYTDDGGASWHSQTRGVAALNEYPASTNPERRGFGYVFIDDDGNGYCPETGRRLAAWSR